MTEIDIRTSPLAYVAENDQVELELCRSLLALLPDEEFDQDGIHVGYEPFHFGGVFPSAAAYPLGSREDPKQVAGSPQPGVIEVGMRIYLPSILATPDGSWDASPRKQAQFEARRLHSLWRKELYDPISQNSTLGGRVHRIEVARSFQGDMNRLGFAIAVDEETDSYLWVHDMGLRVYL